jgi:acyl-CoA thioesterase
MGFAELIDAIPADGREVALPEAGDWMQGRTLYGGASTLLAYAAARKSLPSLPLLRAAQVGFVAPIGERAAFRVETIRQGRNVTQVRSEIDCDGKLALTALFLFGDSREPNALHPAPGADPWPGPPEEAEDAMRSSGGKFFTDQFDIRRAQDEQGPGDPVVRRWVRLRERVGLAPEMEAILIGDALPPGAMRAMRRQGPLSSINWSFNLLDPAPQTRDGWFLAETASDHADHGYSSERLRLWNAEGVQVMAGMQAAAIFG